MSPSTQSVASVAIGSREERGPRVADGPARPGDAQERALVMAAVDEPGGRTPRARHEVGDLVVEVRHRGPNLVAIRPPGVPSLPFVAQRAAKPEARGEQVVDHGV